MAIPLKYLGLSVTDTEHVIYNIKLKGTISYIHPNGNPIPISVNNQQMTMARLRPSAFNGIDAGPVRHDGDHLILSGPGAARVISLISPTDFWGEYTLAK